MNPKIIILRGKPASGKSTAFSNLKKEKTCKDWIFIDFPLIKRMVDNLDNGNKIANSIRYSMLKELLKTRKNIIFEELSRKSLEKNLRYFIKKYRYDVIVFQFEISLEEAIRRDEYRVNDPTHIHNSRIPNMKKIHEIHDEKFDKNAMLVDCEKLNQKQVVNKIIKSVL